MKVTVVAAAARRSRRHSPSLHSMRLMTPVPNRLRRYSVTTIEPVSRATIVHRVAAAESFNIMLPDTVRRAGRALS
jgi:hypothetical protein